MLYRSSKFAYTWLRKLFSALAGDFPCKYIRMCYFEILICREALILVRFDQKKASVLDALRAGRYSNLSLNIFLNQFLTNRFEIVLTESLTKLIPEE